MRHSVLVVKLLGEEGQFPQHGVHLLPLESRVLKSNGGLAEERTGAAIVAAREGEFPLGRPGGGAMARRRELGKALLRLRERLLGLVETSLLEQGAAEDELGVADLVEVVRPAVEQLEGMPRLLLGELQLAAPQVHLGEGGDGVRAGRVVQLERDPERLLELRDRLLLVAEEKAQSAEVVQEPAEVELGRPRRPREAGDGGTRVAVALLAPRLLGPDDVRLVLAMVAIGD